MQREVQDVTIQGREVDDKSPCWMCTCLRQQVLVPVYILQNAMPGGVCAACTACAQQMGFM